MNRKRWLFAPLIALCVACLLATNAAWAVGGGLAPGAPGNPSVWSYAGKQGIGTSYEQYVNNRYQDGGPTNTISKVWFSLAQGIVTETAYGDIDHAQLKDLQLLVTGNDFLNEERVDTDSTVDYLHKDSDGRPLSPAYRLVNTAKNGKYTIEKHIFTDPDRQTLFTRVIFTANEDNITPYVLTNPHMNNTGNQDVAFVNADSLNAREGEMVYASIKSSEPFVKTSAGYVGTSDGYQDLSRDRTMDWTYDYTDESRPGNVAMMAQLPTLNAGETRTFDIVVGFGNTYNAATAQADGSLEEGHDSLLAKYNGEGSAVGWEDYIASLSNVPAMIPNTGDNGKELYASAFTLKSMEDKTHAGAFIASLSVPWGDTVNADSFATGYRAVWPRDFYQVAMALFALGDTQSPLVAFEYLPQVQVTRNTPGNNGATGWFLQKTHVDGTLEWVGVQLDQTAMPIMLGWRLWKAGILSDSQISDYYRRMLKPAAEFIANGGQVNIRYPGSSSFNTFDIQPPLTQQERWEEQHGYSPSTTAAEITGLVVAADIAQNAANDPGAAAYYLQKADEYQRNVDPKMFTTSGPSTPCSNPGEYFVRITPDGNPNSGSIINDPNNFSRNDERRILDGGFLELVRYGVLKGNNPDIAETVCALDNTSVSDDARVRYNLSFDGNQYPGFRRYGFDGYGERVNDGSNFRGQDSNQRGRIWPFFTGERGHYELAAAKANNGGTISDDQVAQLRDTYVRGMEYFANDGLMIPEQVWDGVGANATHNYTVGEGTNSATPLAWSHAEYVKLVKSLTDKKIWDSYDIVKARYQN
ncbi:glucan 1,4-alpha-glucosidase [Rippkaea orientalis PCC 8801]|uniref:Glucan 1,4-alpha-glucosidase n=1 Tax=Rippkaea orientalis (strain PCC 8801 / RF-1) TaxID=41431 RepID=B7JXD8_RIPO1|nr:glucan 1,4-alpha-glucosidase [Rippkaea orientalis]ACK67126.1 glucan 1,4-alpha-glucosidase [Rippkaea orientalis PCC 8801]